MNALWVRFITMSAIALVSVSFVHASVHQRPSTQNTHALERAHQQRDIDARIIQVRQRVCDRLRTLRERLGKPVHLPGFCAAEPNAPQVSLVATPGAIVAGATSTLTWSSTNASSCQSSGAWSGVRPVEGSLIVAPTATSTYVLSCANAEGATTAQTIIGVTTPPTTSGEPPELVFNALPSSIAMGASSTLSWDTTGASECVASGTWSGMRPVDGQEVVFPSLSATYTLMCTNTAGTTTDSVAVTVVPPVPPLPTLNFSAEPENIVIGGTSTLTWSTTNADSCIASDGWSGVVANSGSTDVTPSATTTYTLICTGSGGTTSPSSVIVGVTQSSVTGTPRIVLSEALYDPLSTTSIGNQGSESANEWVELYNAGTAPQTLSGWYIQDAATLDLLPTFTLNPGAFAIITTSTTTETYWSIPPEAQVIALGGLIGNGLGNSGDYLALIGTGSTTIDAISWGSDTQAFTPSISDVLEGSSIVRSVPGGNDTNTALDWLEDTTPSPGQ